MSGKKELHYFDRLDLESRVETNKKIGVAAFCEFAIVLPVIAVNPVIGLALVGSLVAAQGVNLIRYLDAMDKLSG